MSLDPNQDRDVQAEEQAFFTASKNKILGYFNGKSGESDSLRERMLRGAFWFTAGVAGNRAAVAVTTIFVARILGKGGFGDYGTLQSAMTTFALFAGMSLGAVAGRYVAQLAKTDPDRAGRVIALTSVVSCVSGLIITLGAIFGARYIAGGLYKDLNLARPLMYAAPMLFFGAVSSVQINVFTGLEEFKRLNLLQFITAVAGGVFSVIGAAMGDVVGVAIALSVSGVFGWVLFRVFMVRQLNMRGIRLDYAHAWSERSMLWSFALPTFLSNMVLFPVYMIANAVLRRQPGWGQAETAVFTAASQWCNLLLFIPTIMIGPLMPILCQLHAAGDFRRLSAVLKKTLGVNLAVISAGAAILAIFSPIILWLYGKDFKTGNITLWIMLGVAVFQSVTTLINNFLCSAGEMWTSFVFNSIWATLLLIATHAMVPHHQSRGLAASYGLAYAILAVIQTAYCLFYFKKRALKPA
jgi:O-antigen/teichoic acid export membrane protein